MEYFSYVFKISYADYTCVLISGNLLNNLSHILNIELTTLYFSCSRFILHLMITWYDINL